VRKPHVRLQADFAQERPGALTAGDARSMRLGLVLQKLQRREQHQVALPALERLRVRIMAVLQPKQLAGERLGAVSACALLVRFGHVTQNALGGGEHGVALSALQNHRPASTR